MSIVEMDPNRVIADWLDLLRTEYTRRAPSGKDGERIPIDLLSEFSGIRRGAHPSEPCRGIEHRATIGPLDGEALIAIEVKVAGRRIDCHGGNGTAGSDHAVKGGRPP